MSGENSETEDSDEISSVNVELESEESLSTVSSSPCRTLPVGFSALKQGRACHLVHQLFRRETGLGNSNITQPSLKSFPLTKILPKRALRGQVFMGMSRCGRFLMTYSTLYFVPIGEDWYGSVYKYKLHWWAFAPDGPAKEIGSIPLFGNGKVPAPLQIYFCQWPNHSDKVLVYGLMRDCGNIEAGAIPSNQRAYVTVTAVPSSSPCSSCTATAEYYTLSDAAPPKRELKCLQHSFTVHTSFDIAVPYPEFSPKINMKYEDFCVFNTNNALHAIRVNVDKSERLPELEFEDFGSLMVQVPPTSSPPRPCQSRLQELIIRDFADDASLTPKGSTDDSCLSPPLPTRLKSFPDTEPNQSQSSFSETWCRVDPQCAFLTPRIFLKVKKCGMKRLGFRPIFSRRKTSLGLFLESRKSSPYEFVDDSPNEVEKLSQFRRKRLAEKTYEFQDCDSENIVPFSQARLRPSSAQSEIDSRLQVLRPMNRNTPPRTRPQRFWEKCNAPKMPQEANSHSTESPTAENGIIVHDLSGRYKDYTPGDEMCFSNKLQRLTHCFQGTAIRYTRRFHDDDEEQASVVTADMEDDDGSAVTGYHTALNLEVHGPGYCQLRMIHSTNSSLVQTSAVRVEQQSLDIEAICQSVATSLCMVADKTFTFCNDYDVEVLDVCPHSGEVLVLLMMRIEGCEGNKDENSPVEQYEASVTLVWNLIKSDYRVTMVVPPQKMRHDDKVTWNPAREASRKFRNSLPADIMWTEPAVRVCSNNSYLRGVSLASIQDYENRVQFVL